MQLSPAGEAGGCLPYAVRHAVRRDNRAVVALILGLIGPFICPPVCGIFAIVVGVGAINRIDRSNGMLSGRALATAGVALGVFDLFVTCIGSLVLL